MKNIFILIFVCFIKLNAWELYFQGNSELDNNSLFLTYVNGNYVNVKVIKDGIIVNGTPYLAGFLSTIKRGVNNSYISNNEFYSIIKSNSQILNDFYLKCIDKNYFLNYLYNNNTFSSDNYLLYDNVEYLYNSDGLVIESIVNGEWAGFYSDSEKYSSGYLYDSGGTLIYYNGEKVSWIQSAIDKVLQGVMGNLHTLIRLISTPVGVCVSVVFALCLVYYVVELGRRAIKPFDGKVRKRFLEPKN